MSAGNRVWIAAWVVTAGLGLGMTAAAADNGTARTKVRVTGGQIEGHLNQDVIAFKGIPFAAPPVHANRWRAPQPVMAWQGVRQAVDYGPDCMQVPFPGDAAPLGVTPAEDCLHLNVWKPAHPAARKLPVMVWIYGGGVVNGGSSPPEYDGSAFARDGIVLVSFNYRIGNFGFFAHPALSAEQKGRPLGNYGYLDQIAALRWVRKNIAAFGGDPSNVTIFGESAGGMSVHALLLTPLARGLFQKAIIESGAGASAVGGRQLSEGADSAQARGVALAEKFGVHGEGSEALAQLLTAHGQPVYEFRFSYVAESLRKNTPGAGHATEIPYVFDTVAARYGKDLTPSDEAAAHAMHAYWVAFARTGKPEVPGLPAWPVYDPKQDVLMNFTADGPVAQPDPWKDRLDVVQRYSARQAAGK